MYTLTDRFDSVVVHEVSTVHVGRFNASVMCVILGERKRRCWNPVKQTACCLSIRAHEQNRIIAREEGRDVV